MSKYLDDKYLNFVLEDYFENDFQEIDENYQQCDLSIEEVNAIFVANDVVIDESFNLKPVQEYLNKNFNPFLKMGISPANIKLLKTECGNVSANIVSIVKSEGINDNSRVKIYNRLNDFYSYAAQILQDSVIDLSIPNKYDMRNITKSILLLLAIISINTIFITLLVMIDPVHGFTIAAVVVAPLTEEAGKIISIKGKFDKEYFFIFNMYEFTSYVKRGLNVGIELKKLLFMRSIAVLAHFTFTLVHKFMQSNVLRKIIDPKDDEEYENKCTFLGNIIAIVLHSFFNSPIFGDIFWAKIDFLNN